MTRQEYAELTFAARDQRRFELSTSARREYDQEIARIECTPMTLSDAQAAYDAAGETYSARGERDISICRAEFNAGFAAINQVLA